MTDILSSLSSREPHLYLISEEMGATVTKKVTRTERMITIPVWCIGWDPKAALKRYLEGWMT